MYRFPAAPCALRPAGGAHAGLATKERHDQGHRLESGADGAVRSGSDPCTVLAEPRAPTGYLYDDDRIRSLVSATRQTGPIERRHGIMTSGEQPSDPRQSDGLKDPLARSGTGANRSRVRANGLTVSYLDWAGPSSPRVSPTLVLHSALQEGAGMANLASHLSRNGRVIVPDLRGRGETDRPADGYDPATMAADVAALIDALCLERPVVIGRLHGGLVAYHLASRHPDQIRGLVIGGTVPEVTAERGLRMVEGVRALPRRFASFEAALAFYQEQLGLSDERARHDIPHDLEVRDSAYLWRHDLDIVERIERASTPRDDWNLLRTITSPVLVLRGQLGGITDDIAARYRACLPGCAMQTVLGAGHDVFLGTGSEQSFGAIDMFLVRLSDGVARDDW